MKVRISVKNYCFIRSDSAQNTVASIRVRVTTRVKVRLGLESEGLGFRV